MVAGTDAGTDADNRIAADHFPRMQEAAQEGIVLLAGRSQYGIGPAFVIFEVEREEARREFTESVPAVFVGLMRASLHPFQAARVRDQNPR